MKKILLALAFFASPALATEWQVQPESVIEFVGTQNGVSFTGRFANFTAKINFDPANLAAAKADVTVAMAGADSQSQDRDEELPKPEWFDVGQFPTAQFVTTAFRHLGDNRYEADGTLTIKGISRDITLPFTLDIAGDTATMRGEVALQRGDFNVGDSSSTDVGQKVLVRVSLLARALK